jgi:predicted nucleotidyltransferase
MNSRIKDIAKNIEPVLKKYAVKSAGIFGSYARGEQRTDSDVDILVSLGTKLLSLWDWVGFRDELSECLSKPVDLVSDRSIVPYFRDYIYRDLKMIYEQG